MRLACSTTFDSVKAATGLDLGAVIQGQALGRGIADGSQAATIHGATEASVA